MGNLIYSSKKLKLTSRTRTCIYCAHPVSKVKGRKGIYHCPACTIDMLLQTKKDLDAYATIRSLKG